MSDFPGNSDKLKDNAPTQKKPLEKVVTGEVVLKKPGIAERFKNVFFGGDLNTAWAYVVAEVIFPTLRNLAADAVSKGTDRLIYGDNAHRRRPPSSAPRVQYNNPIYRQEPRSRSYPGQTPVDRWAHQSKAGDKVLVGTKEEADLVIERMIDVVDMYQVVSVADLYELIGQESSHVDHKWGWTHMRGIDCRQIRDGWEISFPPLEEI